MMALLKSALPGSVPLLLIAFLVGLILTQWKCTHVWGRRWLWGLCLCYLGFSMPVGGRLVAAPLAWGFAPIQRVEEARGAHTIVVLDSSTLRYHSAEGLYELPDSSGAMRALEAARVYRLLGEPLVIVSGGGLNAEKGGRPEASALRDVLEQLGVPSQRIILDSDSQNTRAHAQNLAIFLRKREISSFVLVTSPTHMRRAIAAFRAMGCDPIPSPSALYIDDMHGWSAFWPSPKALLVTEQAMHDYFGLGYYFLKGWL